MQYCIRCGKRLHSWEEDVVADICQDCELKLARNEDQISSDELKMTKQIRKKRIITGSILISVACVQGYLIFFYIPVSSHISIWQLLVFFFLLYYGIRRLCAGLNRLKERVNTDQYE